MMRGAFSVLGFLVVLAYTVSAYPQKRPVLNEELWKIPTHLGKDPLRCMACLEVMKHVYQFMTANRTEQCLEAIVAKGCAILHIEDTDVCRGAVSSYGVSAFHFLHSLLPD